MKLALSLTTTAEGTLLKATFSQMTSQQLTKSVWPKPLL
jgi:hypothetical protein